MQIISYLLFLFAGLISFITYRLGLTDGLKLSRDEIPKTTVFKKSKPHIETESEKEFFSQYNKLMDYDFDKAGEENE